MYSLVVVFAAVGTTIVVFAAVGATIPALIAGRLSGTVSLLQIAVGYGALALLATHFTVIRAATPDDRES